MVLKISLIHSSFGGVFVGVVVQRTRIIVRYIHSTAVCQTNEIIKKNKNKKKERKNFAGLSVGQKVQFVFYFGYGKSRGHLKYFISLLFLFFSPLVLAKFLNGNQISKRYAPRIQACTRTVRNDLSTKMRYVIFHMFTYIIIRHSR